MPKAIVSEKGWVVIPKEIRDRLGLKKGSKVQIVEWGGVISIEPVLADPIRASAGMFDNGGPSLTEEYLKEKRREEAERDAKFEYYFPSKPRHAIRETNLDE